MKTVGFIAGFVFSIGLALGGMTNPKAVFGFLDFFGSWDPKLIFVMGGAVFVYSSLYWFFIKRKVKPLFEAKFYLPSSNQITARLILGSSIFGIGWAIGGFCPGPGIVSLATLSKDSIAFVVSMLFGMLFFRGFKKIFKLKDA